MTTLSAFLLFPSSPHAVFYLHSPPGEGSATLGPCYLMHSVVVFLIWNLMLYWYFGLCFLQTFFKWDLDTNMRTCFSHLSWLEIRYHLCYCDWEIWGDDLFVEKWHRKAGFHLLQCNFGFERSSLQLLISVIYSFHCDRTFSFFVFRKTEYLYSKKDGFLLPFVNYFKYLKKMVSQELWTDLLGYDYHHFPCSQPLCFSWMSCLRNRKPSLLAFMCAIFFSPCGASLSPC